MLGTQRAANKVGHATSMRQVVSSMLVETIGVEDGRKKRAIFERRSRRVEGQ